MFRFAMLSLCLSVAAAPAWAGSEGAGGKLIIQVVPSHRRISPAPAPTFQVIASAPQPVHVAHAASIRVAPGKDAEIIAPLAPSDIVSVSGKVAGQPWYQVTKAGRTGFVSQDAFDGEITMASIQAMPMIADASTIDGVLGKLQVLQPAEAP